MAVERDPLDPKPFDAEAVAAPGCRIVVRRVDEIEHLLEAALRKEVAAEERAGPDDEIPRVRHHAAIGTAEGPGIVGRVDPAAVVAEFGIAVSELIDRHLLLAREPGVREGERLEEMPADLDHDGVSGDTLDDQR